MAQTGNKSYHWANSALFYYFLAILVWAPLPLGSNRNWSTSLLAGLLLAGLLGALVLVLLRHVRVSTSLSRSWPALAALTGTQVWVAAQLVLDISVDPESTRLALLLGTALVAAFVLTLLLVESRARIRTITTVMIGCGVFQAFFAAAAMMSELREVAFLEKQFSPGSATGTFVNSNHLAGFLEMNLAIGVGMLVAQLHSHPAGNWRVFFRRSIDTLLSRKFRLRLYLVIMVIGLVLTRSRMGNIAFFSSLLLCGALGMVLQQRITRGMIVFFVSLLLVDLYLVGDWFGVDEVIERLQTTTLTGETRDEVARDSLRMWRDNFWLGTGADSFFQAYVYGGYMSPDSLHYRHAHNDYLEIGSGFGFIGFALLGLAVITSLWQSLQAQMRRRSRLHQGLGLAGLMGISSLLIHSFTDFNLHIPANSLWFTILLSLTWVANFENSLEN